MTNWLEILAYSLGGAMLLMMAVGIVLSAFMPAIDRWSRRFFILLFSLLLLSVSVFFADIIIYRLPDTGTAERILVFFEFLTVSALMPMPTALVLHWCGEKIKDSILFRTQIALLCAFFILLIFTQFTNIFYSITPENEFVRESSFALLPLPMVIMMILNIVGVVKRRKKISRQYYIAIMIYLIPMTTALSVYLFNYIATFIVFGLALCAMIMFGLILMDNVREYMHQQQELANERASVMVLQMRPHFIYNTMMGIYYLCDQDPAKAKQVTLDFTTYLRKNFTALASENTIPFRDELEHTRAYLAVEQAQFEDVLFVSFDTPHTMFRVPPLTLQPIVENAVKHGMTASSDPIHISVTTRLTDTENEIIVEDDGPGFNAVDNDEPHIALNNIKQRLELMCGGKLTITPRKDGGTSVKVTIPIQKH
ncbi:MAG: histidine kinase [Ruminococcus sp.]|nr:histidine kinase [Ruminococcus sp.]